MIKSRCTSQILAAFWDYEFNNEKLMAQRSSRLGELQYSTQIYNFKCLIASIGSVVEEVNSIYRLIKIVQGKHGADTPPK